MVAVSVDVFVGLGLPLWRENVVTVPDWLVEIAQESMSEFEVLEMALHDGHYAGGAMSPLLAPVLGGALPAFVARQDVKSSSTNVIGNIGEGVGLATLLVVASIELHEVTRVRRQRNRLPLAARRTPDYVASVSPRRPARQRILDMLRAGQHPRLAGSPALAAFPNRFPIEAKGSMGSANGAVWSAVWQLVEYWHTFNMMAPAAPEIGYGVISCVSWIRTDERHVRLHLLAPRDHAAFCASLNQLNANRSSREDLEAQFAQMGGQPFVEHQDIA